MNPKFLDQDVDVVFLANKGIVIGGYNSHIFQGSAVGSALDLESNGCWFGAQLFFFQQCSPVGIAIFTGEDPQSE